MTSDEAIIKEVLEYFDIKKHQAEVVEYYNAGSLKSVVEKAIKLAREKMVSLKYHKIMVEAAEKRAREDERDECLKVIERNAEAYKQDELEFLKDLRATYPPMAKLSMIDERIKSLETSEEKK